MTDEVVLPELGENIETADVSAVLVSVGDMVSRDQPVIEVETEKASLEVPASAEGRVARLLVSAGDTIKVGQAILVVEAAAKAKGATVEVAPAREEEEEKEHETASPDDAAVLTFPAAPRPSAKPAIGECVPAAPSARALARELGVVIRDVAGSGRGGRITRDDVKAHAKQIVQAASAPGRSSLSVPPLPDFSKWGEVSREPLTRVRRVTASRMANAWVTVPHVTQFDHADLTRLEATRKELNRRPEAAGAKLTVTAVVIKTVAGALARFPQFNASLDVDAGEVVYKKYVHVGVAVDTDRGLLVPVLRDVDSKPLQQVAREVTELAVRARDRKLMPDEMSGAGFTVSNLGGLGTTYFSPIVNWPEVAILGVGRAETRAVHEAGEFRPHLVLPLSISYDHRLIDGADAARFLRWIAEALEQPLLLLLDEDGDRRG
jgi:pyruvate dehydrogenase E2 component (dihydrolipoamide acetyltransferase)